MPRLGSASSAVRRVAKDDVWIMLNRGEDKTKSNAGDVTVRDRNACRLPDVEKGNDPMSTLTAENKLAQVAEFISLEADVLDQYDYQAWLALWVEEGKYVVPVQPDEQNFEDTLNYAYDNAAHARHACEAADERRIDVGLARGPYAQERVALSAYAWHRGQTAIIRARNAQTLGRIQV